MTPEQIAELQKLSEDAAQAWVDTFKILGDALSVASDQLQTMREPLEEFNKKTFKLRSFLLTLNKASEIEGFSGSRGTAGATRRILHKKNVGIIRN